MEETQELKAVFLEKLKPYENRIAELETAEEAKQVEIDSLKVLVRDLHYLLEELKTDKQLNNKV